MTEVKVKVKEVEVVLTQDQTIGVDDLKKGGKVIVAENTAKRMKQRGLIE